MHLLDTHITSLQQVMKRRCVCLMHVMFECRHGKKCDMLHIDTEFRTENNRDECNGEAEYDDVMLRWYESPRGHVDVDFGKVAQAFTSVGGLFMVPRM